MPRIPEKQSHVITQANKAVIDARLILKMIKRSSNAKTLLKTPRAYPAIGKTISGAK